MRSYEFYADHPEEMQGVLLRLQLIDSVGEDDTITLTPLGWAVFSSMLGATYAGMEKARADEERLASVGSLLTWVVSEWIRAEGDSSYAY